MKNSVKIDTVLRKYFNLQLQKACREGNIENVLFYIENGADDLIIAEGEAICYSNHNIALLIRTINMQQTNNPLSKL